MSTTPSYEYYGMMAEFWDLFRGDTSSWDDRFFYGIIRDSKVIASEEHQQSPATRSYTQHRLCSYMKKQVSKTFRYFMNSHLSRSSPKTQRFACSGLNPTKRRRTYGV